MNFFDYFEPPSELTAGALMDLCGKENLSKLMQLWHGYDYDNGRRSYIDTENDWFTVLAEVFNGA
jgi:hypothetical protein